VVDIDRNYMRLALQEAKKGIGRTSPNPCVGAVVVKNAKVAGRGYHKKAGTPHAEIHALQAAGRKAKDATLYVTLEPCNHTGRTPPCTEAVLRAGISRVVIGMLDPNPGVAGGGARYLLSQGLTDGFHRGPGAGVS
jgi:diaminohydroxyphosphoribosylaminopyrimidine deaminase/5-amino-6-(5-phosphoribosylamino)uracil reductase